MNSLSMIKVVVENDMCIGCGLCAAQCKSNSIKMKLNEFGFYVASFDDLCKASEEIINVCPFNPEPNDNVKTENEISTLFLSENNKHHVKIGRYINSYAGYSIKHRLTSSSGGIATYTLTELMRRGEIQHVISVKATSDSRHYQYSISSSIDELANAAKTKYYPVTLGDALKNVSELNGKIAIVGVACFIKAIRLAQLHDPIFNDKVGFLIGIICGGVKSTFFTEYLSSKAGLSVNDFTNPEFRIKDTNSTASDYSYGCSDRNNNRHTIKMCIVGDMWGTGLFKANACDYCDDVTTELADLSLGDAWLEPYSNDGRGTNVIVTRSNLAEDIIKTGIDKGDLVIDELSTERFIASQQGSFNHRHDGLGFRIKVGKTPPQAIPPKRFTYNNLSLLLKVMHRLRMATREKSLLTWKETKNSQDFDSKMHLILCWLRLLTRISHYQRAIIRRIKKVL